MLNRQAVCEKAIAPFRRRGLSQQLQRVIELGDLLSAGMLALIENGTQDEGLAVKVARAEMVDTIRREARRLRGMVEVREGYTNTAGEEIANTDQWDTAIYGKQHLQPVNTHPDLWEAMKALPAREYQVVTLSFWGGKTQEEIATEMGVDQATVSRILDSAKNLLRECINGESQTITKMEGERSFADRPFGRHGGGVGR